MANRQTAGIEWFLLNAQIDVASETSAAIKDSKEKNTASWRFFEVAQRKIGFRVHYISKLARIILVKNL